MVKKKTGTSSDVKRKYNEATYMRKEVRIRKDSELYENIQEYEGSFNKLVNDLLAEHFEVESGIGENPYLK